MKFQAAVTSLFSLLCLSSAAYADTWQQMYESAVQAMTVESYEKAQQQFQSLLKDAAKDKVRVTLARAGLAEALLWQGQFDQSARLFKQVLKDADALGERQEVGDLYDAHAWLLQAQGNNSEALSYAKRALELRKRVLAANDDELAQSFEHLAEISEAQGLSKDAADLYSQALEIRSKAGEQYVEHVANLTEKLAAMQYRLGNRAQATELFNRSLEQKAHSGAVFERYAPHPAWQTLMYRYLPGALNTSRAVVAGESLASITTPDNLTVQATVLPASDFKGSTAFVRVINNGQAPVDFLPKPAVLMQLRPQVKMAKLLESEKLAQQIEKKGNRSAGMIRFFEGGATTPVTSTVYNSGGYVRPGWGWAPPAAGPMPYQLPKQKISSSTSTITTMVPDYEARARAEAKAQAAIAKASEAAQLIRDQKLTAATVGPGEMVQGSLQFDVTGMKEGILRIPIGNAMFEFPLGG